MPALVKLLADNSVPSVRPKVISTQQPFSTPTEGNTGVLSTVAFVEPLMEKLTKKTKQLVTAVYCLSHRLESAMELKGNSISF